MNIQFQICGLTILFLLLLFFKSHRTLQLYKERVFFAVLCLVTVSLVGDVLSLVAIDFRQALPPLFVAFVCKSYVVALMWNVWSSLVYVCTELVDEKKHRILTRYLILLACIQSAVIYLLPIYIFDQGGQVYTYGPSVIAVYIFSVLHILTTVALTVAFRKRMNARRALAILLWMCIWMGSAAIQFLNNALLIVGFSSAVGMLILFVVIENPEANVERRLGCFNAYALTEYLKQLFARKTPFCLMELSFENERCLEEQGVDTYELLRGILHVLSPYGDILVFKNIGLGLVLVSEKPERLEAAGKAVLEHFADTDVLEKNARLVLTAQTGSFQNMDELFRFLNFVRTEKPEEQGVLLRTDESMVARYEEQNLIEQEIRDALAEDRVEVFLQPIYSNAEERFTSAEALMRLRRRDGTLLPPGKFIPLAEENGQILALGERVMEKVCRFLQESPATALGLHYIEVNLSVVQCEKTDLAKRMAAIVNNDRVEPGRINLEITETASISAQKILLENMEELIALGFTFSLDDFGKGESNLMYVVEMPVSIIKLDYDMSKAFFRSEKARQVVRAVVAMAHGMGLKLVAEGIETQEELEAMRAEGIDYIQGFYYAKPLPVEEFLAFLRRNATAESAACRKA